MPTPPDPGPGPDVPWYIPEWMLKGPESGPTGRLTGAGVPGPAAGAGEGDARWRWQDYWSYETPETSWDDRRLGPRAGAPEGPHDDVEAGARVAAAVREGLPFMIGMALVLVAATRPDLVSVPAICAATGFVVGLFVDSLLERAASPRPRPRRFDPGMTAARLSRLFGKPF